MAPIFPADKADYTAENGVTYAWEGDRWRVTFKTDESFLKITSKPRTTADQDRQDTAFHKDQSEQDQLIAAAVAALKS